LPGLIFSATDIRQARENGVVSLEFSCTATSQMRMESATDAEFWTKKILSDFHGVEAEIKYNAGFSVVHVCLRHDDHPSHTLIKYLSDNNFFDPERGNKVNYRLNLRSEISKDFEAEPQSGDDIVVSEGRCKHSKQPAILSVVARSWRSSTRTSREFKWEGAAEISALWDELDEQSLKSCLDGVLSGPLSQDEQCSQVSTIARTLLAVALRRGIDLRSILAEAVKTTTKLLDPTSEVPTNLLSFRNSVFARWGEKDSKRGEREVLTDQRNGLFSRIRFFFHPRKGKAREDGQVPGRPRPSPRESFRLREAFFPPFIYLKS
jgi:hypothetical protein